MKKYKRMLVAASLLASLALAGCNEDQAKEMKAETGASHLNMAFFIDDFKNLDPIIAWNGWNLSRMGVGENLVQIDENMNFKNVVAESWEKVDDFTVKFVIREGVTFHNGKVVDANAVKKSIERALAKTDREDIKIPVETITADGQVLTIKTSVAFPTLVNNLADPVYIIVDVEEALKDELAFVAHPIATGPFKIKEVKSSSEVDLVKHETHWSGEIAVDTVNVKGITDDATRVMALQSGEVDFITQISAKDVALFENNDKFTVLSGPNLRVFQLDLNMRKPYMQNLGFRQALAHGLNKEMYAKNLVNGTPAKGPFTEELSFGYKGEDIYQYDVDKANEILDQEGFVDSDGNGIRESQGKDIILKYLLNTGHGNDAKNVAVAVQDDYKKIGLGVDVIQIENYNDLVESGDYDLVWKRWTSAPTADPAYFIEANYLSGALGNDGDYKNPEIDEIVEEFRTTFDKEQRDALGIKATEILLADVPTLFMYYSDGTVITRSNVTGVERFMSEIYYIDERVKVE